MQATGTCHLSVFIIQNYLFDNMNHINSYLKSVKYLGYLL